MNSISKTGVQDPLQEQFQSVNPDAGACSYRAFIYWLTARLIGLTFKQIHLLFSFFFGETEPFTACMYTEITNLSLFYKTIFLIFSAFITHQGTTAGVRFPPDSYWFCILPDSI